MRRPIRQPRPADRLQNVGFACEVSVSGPSKGGSGCCHPVDLVNRRVQNVRGFSSPTFLLRMPRIGSNIDSCAVVHAKRHVATSRTHTRAPSRFTHAKIRHASSLGSPYLLLFALIQFYFIDAADSSQFETLTSPLEIRRDGWSLKHRLSSLTCFERVLCAPDSHVMVLNSINIAICAARHRGLIIARSERNMEKDGFFQV